MFAQRSSYVIITNDAICIYCPFPVNSQHLRTSKSFYGGSFQTLNSKLGRLEILGDFFIQQMPMLNAICFERVRVRIGRHCMKDKDLNDGFQP